MIVDYLSMRSLSFEALTRHISDLCREAEVRLIAPIVLGHITHDLSTPPAVPTR